MSDMMLIFAGLFLPLFPLSMLFNELFDRIPCNKVRALLLLIWPQVGLYIILSLGAEIPDWLVTWALLTALLYAFRTLVLREVTLWISFLATSCWALLWILLSGDSEQAQLIYYALGFSAPLALLVLLSGELEKRFGAAYTGLYNGIAESLPRLSGVLVMAVLAAIATPLFPAFPAMIDAIVITAADSFYTAFLIAIIWLIWGWAGARLLQGLIIGESEHPTIMDISAARAWIYGLMLTLLMVGGICLIGNLS